MKAHGKQTLKSNHFLKVAALIFGYAFWLILAQGQSIIVHKNIPLSFYMPENNLNIEAPTSLNVGLSGKRIDLQRLDFSNLGAHIDISKLNAGNYSMHISSEHIFLPRFVKLIYYKPVIVDIKLS